MLESTQCSEGNRGIESCGNIHLNGGSGNLTTFLMDATGGIKGAEIDISSITVDDVEIIVESPDGSWKIL